MDFKNNSFIQTNHHSIGTDRVYVRNWWVHDTYKRARRTWSHQTLLYSLMLDMEDGNMPTRDILLCFPELRS